MNSNLSQLAVSHNDTIVDKLLQTVYITQPKQSAVVAVFFSLSGFNQIA